MTETCKSLELEHYPAMTQKALREIAETAQARLATACGHDCPPGRQIIGGREYRACRDRIRSSQGRDRSLFLHHGQAEDGGAVLEERNPR